MNLNLLKNEINEYINNYFKDKGTYNKIIFESMEYSISNGGKRIRPILLILAYKLFKENYKEVLPFACALEMIHCYTLIHDDLPCMDDDDLRRGKPTNHKVYGEAIAVLAGDGLLNEAFNLMLSECVNGGMNKVKAAAFIGDKAGADGVIGGQVVDILSEGKDINKEQLDFIHLNKTAALIVASVVGGAILGGADDKEVALISEYGEKLGLAFQIKDDILDIVGDEKKLGKKTKSDIHNDKNTYVKLYDIETCSKLAEKLTKECFEILDKIKGNTESLKEVTKFLLNRDY